MESKGLNIQNITLNLAVDLVKFYHGVIRKEINSNDLPSNRKILSRLRRMYSQKLRSNSPCSVSFDSSDVRCAYLFQFCPSFTLAIASQFLMLMKGISQQQVQRLALKDSLTVCCHGGGPGTELVAICSVLQQVRKACFPNAENPLLVDATIVDVEPGWSTTAENVVRNLSEIVDPSVVQISNFRFIQYDLTKEVSEDIKRILGQSDVVTMTKFLSALHCPGDPDEKKNILQETCERIPEGGILFLLDSSGWKNFDEMLQTLGLSVRMESIYGPTKKTSRMSKTSKRDCVLLFSTIYGGLCCTAQSSNKAVAWCKMSSEDTS